MTEAEKDLAERLQELRNYKMTPTDKFEQRVSFVYGQQDFDSPHKKTKDEIRAMLYEDMGCPHGNLVAEIERLSAEVERLSTTGMALLTKLDAAMPHIENAVKIATNHSCPYEGEPIGQELDRFRAALSGEAG